MPGNSSYRKAAILIAALDPETADLLLAELSQEVAAAISQEVAELDEIPWEEQQQVVDEFMRHGTLAPEMDPPGLEITDALAERLSPTGLVRGHNDLAAPAAATDFESPRDDQDAAPLHSLQTVDAGVFASALEGEPPQIIAVVIANLPAHRAGDILARLPAATQADVIRRLEGLEQTSRDVLDEIQRVVLARVRQNDPAARRSSGLATVSTILNSADEAARRQILSNLARHDRPLAGKLKRPTAALPRFTFDDVCGLPIDDLMLVVQSAPLETFVLAFAGANAELVEELVDCLPAEASQRFARGIAELGPTRLADIESAQHSLAELASQLSADGRLHGGPPIHLTAVA